MCNRLGKRKRDLLNPPVRREINPDDLVGYKPDIADFINTGDFAVTRPGTLYLAQMPDGSIVSNTVIH